MSRARDSIVVTEAEWRDAIKIARILRHREYNVQWRIRRLISLAAYLLKEPEQAEEIRTRNRPTS